MVSRKIISICLVALLSLFLSSPSYAADKPLPGKGSSHPEFTINVLTAPLGSGDIEAQMGIGQLLKQKHPWLRINAQETAGYGYNFKAVVQETWRHPNTIIHSDTFTPRVAEKKEAPYDAGLKEWAHMALWGAGWIPQFVMTSNPDIKTIEDLKGKRLVTGLKAGNVCQISLRVMKIAGLLDEINWQYAAFSRQVDMLNDGLADAGWVYTYVNPITNEFGHTIMITEAAASGRPYRLIGPSDKQAEAIVNAGYGLRVYKMSSNIVGGKDDTKINAIPHVGIVAADDSLPEEAAYELVKFILDNIDDVRQTGGYARSWTRESMVMGIGDILHPGAARAYKEAGLLK